MSAKADRVAELLKIKERNRYGHSSLAHSKILILQGDFTELRKRDEHLLRQLLPYFPIALVTAIEVYFRSLIAELIDKGTPFAERAEGLAKNVRFDLSTIHALQGRAITIGEVIAQGQSLQRLDFICSTMETLMAEPFLPAVAGAKDRWQTEIEKKHDRPIVADIDKLASTIARLLEARHIVVHELPQTLPFATDDVVGFIDAAKEFTDATRWYVSNKLDPNAPLQQGPMNEAAAKAAEKAERELEQVVEQLLPKIRKDRRDEFNAAQLAWDAFRKASAEFAANEYRGGSISGLIYSSAFEDRTKERTSELRRLLEFIESDPRFN